MCMLFRQEREQGRTTARVEREAEKERMEGIREAGVNDKKLLRSDILKCQRVEVSLDGVVEYKGFLAVGTTLICILPLCFKASNAPQHAAKKPFHV